MLKCAHCGNSVDREIDTRCKNIFCSPKCFYDAKRKYNDISGRKFGRLTVIEKIKSSDAQVMWICKCECGKEIVLPSYTIWRGTVISCGCHNKYGGLTVKQNHIYKQCDALVGHNY